jgi:hypothetical protein
MNPMRKRLVVKVLLAHECRKIEDDGRHGKRICPCGRRSAAVPRHSEISAGVVRSLQVTMACLPKGWLQ